MDMVGDFFLLQRDTGQRPPQQIVPPLEHLQGVSMERKYAFSIH